MSPLFLKKIGYGWSLFKSDYQKSLNYFQNNDLNTELNSTRDYITTIKKPSVAHTNTSYIYYTNEIFYSNIKQPDNVWKFRSLSDNKYYDVYNVIFITNDIVIYFFNKSDPIFIIACFAYMEIYYIGYLNQKKIILLNHSTSGADMKFHIIENYLREIIMSSKTIYPTPITKQFLFFGYCGNVGHHLFNEISGLVIFLNNPHLFSKIQGICIGPYDFFGIRNILKNKYNFNIISLNNDTYLNLRIYPIFLNSFILDKKLLIPFFKLIFDTNLHTIVDTKNIDENNYFSTKPDNDKLPLITSPIFNDLKIVFDIRTLSRNLKNMIEIYTKIINYIYLTYHDKYIIKIIFVGRFTTNINNINLNTDAEYIQQITCMNNIIKSVNNTDIFYRNFIGKNILITMNTIKDARFAICIGGTCVSNLMNWIFRKKMISFCNTSFYTLVQDMQYDCLQNYDALLPPINCVTDLTNGDFIIDYNKAFPFLINTINSFMSIFNRYN